MSESFRDMVGLASIKDELLEILRENSEGLSATVLVEKAGEKNIADRRNVQRAVRQMLDGGTVALGRSFEIELPQTKRGCAKK